MVAGSFGVVTLVSAQGRRTARLDDYRGLRGSASRCWRSRSRCSCFAQAGVPLTAGFFAKFYVLSAAVDADSYGLAVVAMMSAVIAAFLYLRIIVTMYMSDDDETAPETAPARTKVPFAAALGAGSRVRVHGGRRLPPVPRRRPKSRRDANHRRRRALTNQLAAVGATGSPRALFGASPLPVHGRSNLRISDSMTGTAPMLLASASSARSTMRSRSPGAPRMRSISAW